MALVVEPLREVLKEALEEAFSRVPLSERIELTKSALAPFSLPEEALLEAASTGVFHGYIPSRYGYPLFFTRYGSTVLQARKVFEPLSGPGISGEGWVREDPTRPLSSPPQRHPGPFPKPLLEGLGQALALVANREGVAPPPPFTEPVVFFGTLMRAGDLVLAPFGVFDERFDDVDHRLLVLGQGGAVVVDPLPIDTLRVSKELYARKEEAWGLLKKVIIDILEEKPAHLPEKALVTLLEGEDLSGELAVEALRNQKLFRFLGPSLG
jgi:hypothetical protein